MLCRVAVEGLLPSHHYEDYTAGFTSQDAGENFACILAWEVHMGNICVYVNIYIYIHIYMDMCVTMFMDM